LLFYGKDTGDLRMNIVSLAFGPAVDACRICRLFFLFPETQKALLMLSNTLMAKKEGDIIVLAAKAKSGQTDC